MSAVSSIFIPMRPIIIQLHIHGNVFVGDNIDIYDNPSAHFNDRQSYQTSSDAKQAEDIEAVDTSFFCTERYDAALCEKNLREAIAQAKSKAEACRKIMLLETCGYIRLSNVSDERKAELVNPFTGGKYEFCGQDFCQARNRQ